MRKTATTTATTSAWTAWIAFLATLHCIGLSSLRAQTNEQAEATVHGLVAALNAKDPKLLRPLLADQCTVPGLDPKQFAAVMDQVVAKWSWTIAAHRLEPMAPGVVLVTLVAANKGEHSITVRLDAAAKFVELPLISAQVTRGGEEPPIAFAGPDTSTMPLVAYGDLWAVRAKVGNKEGLWLIDSGAPKLVLDASGAVHDGGTRTGAITSSVTGALTYSEIVDIDKCELGGHVASKLNALRLDLAHLTQHDAEGKPIPFMGLIGKRELAAFETRFDFEASTLTLVKLNDAGDPVVPRPATLTERHAFELRDHLVLLRFAAGDTQLTLEFDTGSNVNHLLGKHAENPALVLDDVTTDRLIGASSDVTTARYARVSGLSLDGRALPPMRTCFSAAIAIIGTDGIVGLPWVAGRPFALNYAQRCIVFGARRGDTKSR